MLNYKCRDKNDFNQVMDIFREKSVIQNISPIVHFKIEKKFKLFVFIKNFKMFINR